MNALRSLANAASTVLTAAALGLACYGWLTLPPQVPTGISGDAVRYGDKVELLFIGAIGVVVRGVFFYAQRQPVERMNLPVRVTPRNRARIAPLAYTMLAVSAAAVSAIIVLVVLLAFSGGGEAAQHIGRWIAGCALLVPCIIAAFVFGMWSVRAVPGDQ